MKVADLLDEHGLEWFKGSAIFFGISWGLAAALLIYLDPVIANIILAMNLAFLIRGNIDYTNHALAVVVIVLSFVYFSQPTSSILLGFTLVFLILGTLRDKDREILQKYNSTFLRFLFYNGMQLVYGLPALIYSIFYGSWNIFWVFFLFAASYDLTKHIGRKKGYK